MSTKPIPTQPSEQRVDETSVGKPSISWWWLAPFALAVAAAPFVWRPLLRMTTSLTTNEAAGTATPTNGSQIGFSATHEGSDWRLVWNRQAMARLEPVGAILTITDGGLDRQQFLSARDLAAGAVVYVPRTTDLTFNLKVTIPNAPEIEEQIRVLSADGDKQADANYAPAPRRVYGEAPRTEPSANRAYPGQSQAAAQPRRAFQPPTTPLVRVAPVDEPAPALPNVGLPVASAPGIQGVAGTPVPPRPAPAKPAAAPPAAAPKADPVVPRIVRTEASPVRSVTASWPRNTTRDGAVEIKVRVQIDTKGRVTNVVPINRNVRNFAFVDSAVTAARMWTFSPAMENGKPVVSESVLTFKFNP